MTTDLPGYPELGFSSFFSSQLPDPRDPLAKPARIMAVHRGQIAVQDPSGLRLVPSHIPDAETVEDYPTVGDWVLLDPETETPIGLLRRSSLFKRRAPGPGRSVQLIAANIDTAFIVSSCNRDFNIARLERYLVLAREAGVMPVIVLTKSDLADTAQDLAAQARRLQSGLLVEVMDARQPEEVACLAAWCGPGQTVAVIGSSGVGKTTLINTLIGDGTLATGAVREDDARGRHTTTGRSMHRLPQGGWLLDTPGMRELQLTDMAEGLEEVFDDIAELALACRFADCAHEHEPGCAVLAAVADGQIEPSRLERWRKLMAEDRFNTETLAERRARDRSFGKMVRNVTKDKRHRRAPDD